MNENLLNALHWKWESANDHELASRINRQGVTVNEMRDIITEGSKHTDTPTNMHARTRRKREKEMR